MDHKMCEGCSLSPHICHYSVHGHYFWTQNNQSYQIWEQPAQGSGVTIPGDGKKQWGHGTSEYGLVAMVVLG